MSLLPLWFLGCRPEPPAPPPDPAGFTLRYAPGPVVAPPPGARSLVVVVGCTVRADQTAPYGGPETVTPFLAELAAAGVVIDDVVAAAPWTRPAATALLTGRHAATVGMADPGAGPDDRVLPDGVVTLAEHLRDAGFATIGVSANPNVHPRWGLDQGFAAFRAPSGAWTADGPKLPGAAVVAEVESALAAAPQDRPVFLVVVLVDAHAPHDAPDAERDLPEVPASVAAYRSSLRRFDAAARDAVAAARRRLRDPLVVVVSDHGEGLSFPPHHGRAHGRFLAPSAARGVWVLAGPGLPAGARVRGTVSQIDVAPTLAALAGAPGFAAEGEDRSRSIALGADVPPGLAIVDTWFQDVDRAAVYGPDRACQVDLSGAPPADGFVDGCFDRAADPTHLHPFADPTLTAEVLRFRAARDPSLGAGAPPDPALDAALEALGYRSP